MTSVVVLSKPPFSLKTLVKDSNCVLIQDPSAIWGGSDHLPRRNLLLATDALATQNVTVTAESHTLYIQGTGSVTLSGTGSGTLQGTGANDRVSLVFTPTAGTLTLTVSGTVTFGFLCKSSVTDRSYQKITDWTTEQYAWAATKNVPWLRRNMLTYTEDFSNAAWGKTALLAFGSGSTVNAVAAPDGTMTADLITESTATSGHVVYVIYSSIAGTTYTASVYVQAGPGSRNCNVRPINGSGAGSDRGVTFNPSTGAFVGFTGTTGADPTYTIQNVGSNWFRVSVTATCATASASASFLVGIASGSDTSYAGNGTSGLYIWGAQLSVGTCDYQRIATTWPAEYTSLATAAGYPISLYSDRAGTTATVGPDDPVGVLLDQSDGLALGPELVTNGQFTSDVSGWSPANSVATRDTTIFTSGGLKVVSSAGGQATAFFGFTTTVGATYKITGTLYCPSTNTAVKTASITANQAGGSIGISCSTEDTVTTGAFLHVATATTTYVCCCVLNPGVAWGATGDAAYFDNISVREIPGYHATAPSDAARPNLRLDGNGKFYLDRDTTDDNLPIMWPTVLSESQLGPELVANGGFDSDTWWTKSGSTTISGGKCNINTASVNQGIIKTSFLTSGKTYRVTYTIDSVSSGEVRPYFGTVFGASRSAAGTYSDVVVCGSTNQTFGIVSVSAAVAVIDNISVREVTGTNVIYTATGDYTTKDSGLILSGATDYKYPQRPSGDYGRIVMAADSKYDAKIIKYLDAKRGRSYLLGPERYSQTLTGVFENSGGGATTAYTQASQTVAVTVAGSNTSYPRLRFELGSTAGRSYYVKGTYLTTGAQVPTQMRLASAGAANNLTFSGGIVNAQVAVAGDTGIQFLMDGTKTGTFQILSLSVREILL